MLLADIALIPAQVTANSNKTGPVHYCSCTLAIATWYIAMYGVSPMFCIHATAQSGNDYIL